MIEKKDISLEERLERLASFLDVFTRDGFEFGHFVEPSDDGEVITMGYFTWSPEAEQFVKTAYDFGWVLRNFDWPGWAQTTEAARLRDDPATLAYATDEQLARLLTVCIRQDRFCEGALYGAYTSGLLTGILRRARHLLKEVRHTSD